MTKAKLATLLNTVAALLVLLWHNSGAASFVLFVSLVCIVRAIGEKQ